MKILFIGGTGIISSACAARAIERGYELILVNRGQTSRPPAIGSRLICADIRNPAEIRDALAGESFDVVVNWVAYTPDHIQTDLDLFLGKTEQYVFISSASAYQKPLSHLPITESTPLANPFWQYSRDKIACEETLMRAYRQSGFPITIVRPSHTYDRTLLPFHGGYTMVDRMRNGKPVIVHGDGTSLWVLTHHQDFAVGFNGLLGHPGAIGDTFQITTDELLTWNQIYRIVARAANTEAKLVHIPSDIIDRYDPDWGAGLLGDKAHSVIFDNAKIRRLVPNFNPAIPFARGAEEIMSWYDADPTRQEVNRDLDRLMDRMISDWDINRKIEPG